MMCAMMVPEIWPEVSLGGSLPRTPKWRKYKLWGPKWWRRRGDEWYAHLHDGPYTSSFTCDICQKASDAHNMWAARRECPPRRL